MMTTETLMTDLKEKQEQARLNCLALARYHRAEARKYRNDPNTAAYHKQRAGFWQESARYWKTHLPNN